MIDIREKGVINVIELVIVMTILIVSFNIFFPNKSYDNRWEDAYGILLSRDAVLVLERTDKLHEYAFDSVEMENFIENIFPNTNLILWYDVTGGIGNDILIACDDPSVISEMNDWVNGLRLNDRNVNIEFCYTDMSTPDSCLSNSDTLLIWGYKDLDDYENVLNEYVSDGNGIIEVMEVSQIGNVQTNLFGLNLIGSIDETGNPTTFTRDPIETSDRIYEPWKYFYKIPMPLDADEICEFDGCLNPNNKGIVTFAGNDYGFCICDDGVWFDTNGGEDYTQSVGELENIVIGGHTFHLSYINSDSKISLSIVSDYDFEDFDIHKQVEPDDSNEDRILLETFSLSSYPVVILNELGSTNVAWVSPLADGIENYGDDDKHLLTSLLLWSSNKESKNQEVLNMRVGYRTTYIKTKNRDMFEIYSFNFGVGYPF